MILYMKKLDPYVTTDGSGGQGILQFNLTIYRTKNNLFTYLSVYDYIGIILGISFLCVLRGKRFRL